MKSSLRMIGLFGFLAILVIAGVVSIQPQKSQAQTPPIYVLAPWVWNTTLEEWWPPDCAIASLDLRTISEMASPGLSTGFGLFQFDSACPIPTDAVNLGNDLNEALTPAQAITIETALTLPRNSLDTSNVTNAIWGLLTVDADITGQTAPRPIMPDTNLNMTLALGGEILRSEPFNVATHSFVISELQYDYELARIEALKNRNDSHRKLAGYWEQKYGFDVRSPEQQLDGLIEPQTTIMETWTCANSGNPDCDLNWTETFNGWGISSNRAQADDNNNRDSMRAETPLSSDDQYIECICHVDTANNRYTVGVAGRYAGGADTFYGGFFSEYSQKISIYKYVLGTGTFLTDDDISVTASSTYQMGLLIEGSTLTATLDTDSYTVSTTDTSITGNLYTGMTAYVVDFATFYADSFMATDELATPTPTPTPTPSAGGDMITDESFMTAVWLLAAITTGVCAFIFVRASVLFAGLSMVFMLQFGLAVDSFMTWIITAIYIGAILFLPSTKARG